jgi:hypothetical protein
MSENKDAWMNEQIPRLISGNWMYKLMCWFLFKKKLTYKEYYVLVYSLHRGKLGEKVAKENAMKHTVRLYKFHHNNKMPNELEND